MTSTGRIDVARCGACGCLSDLGRARCPHCWDDDLHATSVASRGAVYTYTVVHRNDTPEFRDLTPYAVVAVDLDEGWRVVARLEGDPKGVAVGAAVDVAAVHGPDESLGYVAHLAI